MCIYDERPQVTSKSQGIWLSIYINDQLHLSLYLPSLVKVQTWLDRAPWWKFWNKRNKYTIETTHKGGVQDVSEYWDRYLWNEVTEAINSHISDLRYSEVMKINTN